MGHGILYCTNCQTQLRDPDFDKGAAYRLEGQPYCEKCSRELIATLPEDRVNEILRAFESTHDDPPEPPVATSERRGNRTTRIMKALAASPGLRILTSTSRRMATVPPTGERNPAPLIAGIGIAVVLLVVLAVAGMSSDSPRSKTVSAKPLPPPIVIPEAAPAAEDRPAKLIAAAREFARRNPDDLQKQIALFEEVGIEPGAARYSEEISAALRELRRKVAERRTSALAPVEKDLRAAAGRQDFKTAAARIAEARSRRGDPEWDRALDRLSEDLEKEIARALVLLRNQAVDAKRRGASEDVRRIQERVAGWGRPDLSREIETALAHPEPTAPVAPPPPPPTPAPSEAELRETAANDLLLAAEGLYRSPATRGDALLKFYALQSDFGTTRLVAAKRALIAERLEAAKDHLLLAVDLRPTGAWRFSAWKKVSACWTADADVAAAARPQNGLDASFTALPGLEYTAWVYAGACCAEAFVFHAQGTDLAFLDPKTREKSVAEIGSGMFVTLKPATSLLRSHAAHGARRDPTVWQWVTLPPAKYATAGEKRLRFFGETQGFSVAWVGVSATRRAHPADTEMKDLEKLRPDSAADGMETRLRQGLVAHWKMDEGTGATAADATGRGNAGTMRGGVGWTPGVIGKALKFDKTAGYLDCGTNDALNLRKTLTLTAWVKCTADPAQYDGVVMKSNKDWLAGYGFFFDSKSVVGFFVGHCSNGCTISEISSANWNHLAGTYDGKRVRIFVNGKEGIGKDYALEIPPCSEPLWIGRASTPNAGQFTLNGEIDDVRLYDRALEESEIRALSALRR